MLRSLVGSEMCIRDSSSVMCAFVPASASQVIKASHHPKKHQKYLFHTIHADAMTPSDQLLYTSCEYGIDNNGVPYRRGEDEKDTPLPGGCETTLLLSSDELSSCLRHLRRTRLKLKRQTGEGLKQHGDYSASCNESTDGSDRYEGSSSPDSDSSVSSMSSSGSSNSESE
eukprot:TRINITY_DN16088_c0_g1_i1.p1 TRINITY_DN16088_c0_g1~~TRINITY_DN16088_c0_g1_i1.p1  ORF type:complete len:170 (-),score=24.84 TRINITY_DN16088_c0_g1_i1:5-514(-)